MSRRDGTRLRWWLWRRLIRLPSVCTANAHSRIIGRYRDRKLWVDDVCRSDLARTGACWCGKLVNPDAEVVLPDGCVGGHSPDLVSCEFGADWP